MLDNLSSANTMDDARTLRTSLTIGALLAGLALTRIYSYLLFHSAVEVFTVAVAVSVFFLAWNARRFLENHYLLYIGIAWLFVAAIDSVHALAYKGMGIIAGGANPATQLWIAGRYVQSVSFLIAPAFLKRKLNPAMVFGAYAAAAFVLIAAILHGGAFPDCYVEGAGLTRFKIASEYAVILVLVASSAVLLRVRAEFDRVVWKWLSASILLTITSELAFTLYADVYGAANMAGHLLRFVAFCCIYRAIIVTGLIRPYDLLFRNLAQSEQALRRADVRHRAFLANSSEGIFRVELEPPLPVAASEDEQYRHIVEHGYIAECNDAFARMHGRDRAGEVVGMPLARLPLISGENLRAFVRSGYRTKDAEYSDTLESGEFRFLASSFTGVVEDGFLLRAWGVERDITERRRAAMEREELITELRRALAEVKTLTCLLPMCANCRKIRDDKGYWTQVEAYLEEKAGVSFSHGICPECLHSLYPDLHEAWESEKGRGAADITPAAGPRP